MKSWLSLSLTSALMLAASAPAAPNAGYLAPGEIDVAPILEPAPRPGDPRYATDRKIFRATRHMIGSARWQLATADADSAVPALLRDFSCAAGVSLTPQNAPKLTALVQRAGVDTSKATGRAKNFYQRERPYVIDHGRICQPEAELLDRARGRPSYDYPSGHTTWGWTWALVLTSLAPDRAQQILERGRAYGDSRFVCGAHNESAVEAGMISATATMALVQTKAAYKADLAAARAELDALRAGGAAPPSGCDAEAALLRTRTMPPLDKGD